MRGTSASERRSTSRSGYLAALGLATLLAFGLSAGEAIAEPVANERAFELFQRGDELYRQGQFAEAAEKFREAYALDPNPTLLYNLARSYESLGDLERAAETYRDYLEKQPEATDRAAIERRIETLEQQIAEREALERAAKRPPPKAEPAPAPAPASAGPGPVPWVLVGIGAAALVTGGILRVVAENKHASAEDDPNALSAIDQQDDAETFATASGVALIAGGVLAAAGISWLVVGSGSNEAAFSPTLSVRGHF